MVKSSKFIIGIDEAGRGPLAGAVFVGAFVLTGKLNKGKRKPKILKGIKDSKKLSAKEREEWFNFFKKEKETFYISASVGNKTIDRIGITNAVKLAIKRIVDKLEKTKKINSRNCLFLLDGLLSVSEKYNQKTIIKGDEKEPLIAAASIVAKVGRDKEMCRLHKKFPQYGFDKHKGYGTKLHYRRIKRNGTCPIHRRTYLKKVL